MSEIQQVCGTARVSYMCACGDLEPCCCCVCAKWLHCALVLSQECARMPKHRAMCLWVAWVLLCSCVCELVSACVSVCACVE